MKSVMYQNIMEQPQVLSAIVESNQNIDAFTADLLAHKTLYLVGTGASLMAAQAAVPAFAAGCGRIPHVIAAGEVFYYTHMFDRDSAVVLISQSGDSYETVKMCEWMHQRGLPFWGITNEPESTLCRMATRTLLMEAGKELSSATKTYTATLMLLLQVAAVSEPMRSELAALPCLVQEAIALCQEPIERIAPEFVDWAGKPMYVLADSINTAAAQEAALMLKEKARILAEGMTASAFRHGAVEVIEPGLKILFCAPIKDQAGPSEVHIRFLQEHGCDVTVVAPQKPECIDEAHFIPLPECPNHPFTALPVVVPCQLLAERIADLMGLDVDGFRYLSKVVASY